MTRAGFYISLAFISSIVAVLAASIPPHGSTVQDMVDCLGNKTRYSIRPDGSELYIASTPWLMTNSTEHDDAVLDCMIALMMVNVNSQVVPLEWLHHPALGQSYPPDSMLDEVEVTRLSDSASIAVPLSFVPTSNCKQLPFRADGNNVTKQEGDSISDSKQVARFVTYRASTFDQKGCPFINPKQIFHAGDTDCIQTERGEPAWRSVTIDNWNNCALIWVRAWVHHRCSRYGTGAPAPPKLYWVLPGAYICLNRRTHSFCAVVNRNKVCQVHPYETTTWCT